MDLDRASHTAHDGLPRRSVGWFPDRLDPGQWHVASADDDLAALFYWGESRFAGAVLAAYVRPVDEAARRRAAVPAACRRTTDVAFGLEIRGRDYVDAGSHTLAPCARREAGTEGP